MLSTSVQRRTAVLVLLLLLATGSVCCRSHIAAPCADDCEGLAGWTAAGRPDWQASRPAGGSCLQLAEMGGPAQPESDRALVAARSESR